MVVLEVPAGSAGISRRAVELADEFGTMMAHLLPGVQARKASIMPATATPLEVKTMGRGLLIDVPRRMVTVDGVPVRLAYREFELLKFLCSAEGRVVSRAELLHTVWGDLRTRPSSAPAPVSGRTVDTHVQRLRAKLGSHGRSLVTVRGRGYRFDPSDDARIIVARGESRIS